MRTVAHQRNLLVATLTTVALLTSALAALSPASPAQGQGGFIISWPLTALDIAGCTDGTFVHSDYTRINGSNNDIFDDCETLVTMQRALAAQTSNNSLAHDNPLRLWGTATQQKLTLPSILFGAGISGSAWGGVTVGQSGTTARITGLTLSGIQSTAIPSQLGNLTALTTLTISDSEITSLPTQIGSLTGLTRLDLSENRLTTLPTQIGSLTGLTRLDLSENRLTSLPTQIGSLTNLTNLFLSDNSLTSLPAQIGSLTNLQQLLLSNNSLTTLPTQIGSLTNLVQLWLNGNSFTTLPAQILSLAGLRVLHSQSNSLTSLPAELGQLASLDYLDISDNQLTEFTPLTELLSENGGSLDWLELCSNSFSGTIPKALFEAKDDSDNYVLKDRPPDHCWTLSHETSWDVVSVTSTIGSPGELAGNLGLSPDIGLYRWDAVHQLWIDIDLASSLAEGEAIAYRGRGLVAEDDLTAQNLGIADENVTVTLNRGWNILKPPEVAGGTPSGSRLSVFDDSLLDCSSISGNIITAALDVDSLTWKFSLPCHPSVQRRLLASPRISALTDITENDVLYTYFISALPISVTWNTTINKYQP